MAVSATPSMDLEGIVHQLSTIFGIEFSKPYSYMSGGSHDIFLVDHPLGETWSIRVPKSEDAAFMGRKGITMLRYLNESRPHLQVPRLIHESAQYTVLRYLKGEAIESWDSTKLPDEMRHQLLDSLAVFLFELWSCPAPETARSISYKAWLQEEVDRAFLRSLKSDSGWCDPVTFLHRRAILDSIVPSCSSPDAAIKHGDLSAWNVLADGPNITGVIDWDTSQFVPMPAAVQQPLFMADIPGWKNAIPDDMTFEDDRRYLEGAVSKLAGESSHPRAQSIAQLLSSCFERQFFELSLRNKRINERYIDLRINGSEIDGIALQEQLEAFLVLNPSLRYDASICTLEYRLSTVGKVTI